MAENREMKEYVAGKRKRRLKRGVQRFLVLFVAVLVILGTAGLITHLIQSSASGTPEAAIGAPTAPLGPDSIPAALSGIPGINGSEWNFIGPVPQTINTMGVVTPDYRMIALPENGRIDMSYFETTTFIGDSISQGLNMYQIGIHNAHYCAYKSMNIRGVYDGSIHKRADQEEEVPMDALVASAPDNVYILLGTNDLNNIDSDEVVLAYYKEMLDAVRANLPAGVHYYIQSITPIRPEVATARLNNERIVAFNSQLAKLAWEEGIYYVDLHEALAGDDGYLRADFAGSDGVHMNPDGYAAWVDYLVTHTAYDPRNPYLEGSSYYQQAPSEAPQAA